jgi:hypothetical protein
MDHQNLTSDETQIVKALPRELEQSLFEQLPAERRGAVAYAVVMELAEYVFERYHRAAPPPPASLCGIKTQQAGNVQHCKLAVNHAGPCCHD